MTSRARRVVVFVPLKSSSSIVYLLDGAAPDTCAWARGTNFVLLVPQFVPHARSRRENGVILMRYRITCKFSERATPPAHAGVSRFAPAVGAAVLHEALLSRWTRDCRAPKLSALHLRTLAKSSSAAAPRQTRHLPLGVFGCCGDDLLREVAQIDLQIFDTSKFPEFAATQRADSSASGCRRRPCQFTHG